jgi:Na+/proline symporter
MILWLFSIAVSAAGIVAGVIFWKRRRRIWGALLVGLGLFVLLAPLPTLQVKVELPPAMRP